WLRLAIGVNNRKNRFTQGNWKIIQTCGAQLQIADLVGGEDLQLQGVCCFWNQIISAGHEIELFFALVISQSNGQCNRTAVGPERAYPDLTPGHSVWQRLTWLDGKALSGSKRDCFPIYSNCSCTTCAGNLRYATCQC